MANEKSVATSQHSEGLIDKLLWGAKTFYGFELGLKATMEEKIVSFEDPDTLFGKLCSSCSVEWDTYCNHEFVRRIGDATLPKECFRHYLIQDYLFLIQFSRAWALAVFKAETLEDMRAAAKSLSSCLDYEMMLHVKYCAGWGIEEKEMQEVEEANANMAYTRYVLDRGLSGDILDLFVALAPCIIGYAVIGRNLAADPKTKFEGNSYKEWIETYAAEDYQKVAKEAVAHLDQLALSRLGPARFQNLAKTFCKATSLEIGFWDMGLNLLE